MQTWVDFATIKQSVGLAPVLRRYQVFLRRSGRDQYRGLCPIHRGEGRDAFHANLSRNIYCFSCGAGGRTRSTALRYHRVVPSRQHAGRAKREGQRPRPTTLDNGATDCYR